MDRNGNWDLTPAYDLCHAEGSDFTPAHQLSINGKTDGFTQEDLKHLAEYAGLPQGREKRILEQIVEEFQGWRDLAAEIGMPEPIVSHVLRTLRLQW